MSSVDRLFNIYQSTMVSIANQMKLFERRPPPVATFQDEWEHAEYIAKDVVAWGVFSWEM
jgi:hypothetical protein